VVAVVSRGKMISIICCIDAVAAVVAVVSGMGECRKYHACASQVWCTKLSQPRQCQMGGRRIRCILHHDWPPRMAAVDGLVPTNAHGHRCAHGFETSCPRDVYPKSLLTLAALMQHRPACMADKKRNPNAFAHRWTEHGTTQNIAKISGQYSPAYMV
jgi:hypothetical protein